MKPESLDIITLMQKRTSNIRNICVLAHVDHGKTTLADNLIASNQIISARLAGKLRYMDSREDEQKRGITMKSSSISLYHRKGGDNFLINLIDSPGHIDFSSEVSTAVRICDGALVVVDVVEGVCPQTNAVLRQAWLEGIKPCLVLNKIDRLITELKMSPLEAFYHIQKVLEQVNAVTGTLFSLQVMEQSSKQCTEKEGDIGEVEEVFNWSSGLDEVDDDDLYFSPSQGNVVFSSAIDGWAFSIERFAEIYEQKLGISKRILLKTLWGDYFLNMKTKKIFKGCYAKGKKPLFVQFILENLWSVYDAVLINRNKEKIDKIVNSLNLKISARDAKFTEFRVHLHAILRQWLPLADAILDMVCGYLPSPLDICEERVKKLMCGGFKKFEAFPEDTQRLKDDFMRCSPNEDAPVIVFVSKMLSVEASVLPQNRKKPLTKEELAQRYKTAKERHAAKTMGNDTDIESSVKENTIKQHGQQEMHGQQHRQEQDDNCFVAFARVFSGTLRRGAKLYVLGPKYNPASSLFKEVSELNSSTSEQFDNQLEGTVASICEISDLYVMMGREFELVDEVPVGNILGISGLGDHILKSATISTTLSCPPFTAMNMQANPIVRVAVEPSQPSKLPLLISGMKLLNQSDPCVQVLVQETGEYVLVASGEVHLQRCVDDLQQRFAKIEVHVSEPIVPFRETVVSPPKVDMVNEEISGVNKTLTHHTQRLPAFMLREIQTYSDTIYKREETDESHEQQMQQLNMTKEQLQEMKKSTKIKEKVGLIEVYTPNKQYCMCLHAKPLPQTVLNCLEKNVELLKIIQRVCGEMTVEERLAEISNLTSKIRKDIHTFYDELKDCFEKSGKLWRGSVDRIWSIGPKGSFNNVLLNSITDYARSNIWFGLIETGIVNSDSNVNKNIDTNVTIKENGDNNINIVKSEVSQIEINEYDDNKEIPVTMTKATKNISLNLREYDNSIISGFQLATQYGPMCEEPVMGVAFIVTEWNNVKSETNDATAAISYNPLSGQYISAFREGCRRAMMAQPMRLMAAMYTCSIQATTEVLGKMYSVLNKREGRILSEDLMEGSDIFDIKAELPVAESFGFAEEIRKKTSGLASPQLVFSHWQVIDVDPFWVPTTEEEYELYGVKADSENQALKYVNKVRKRKGLYVEQKIVEHAEKQRTLKRNK